MPVPLFHSLSKRRIAPVRPRVCVCAQVAAFGASARFLRKHVACSALFSFTNHLLFLFAGGMGAIAWTLRSRPLLCVGNTLVPSVFRKSRVIVTVASILTVFAAAWATAIAFQVLTMRSGTAAYVNGMSGAQLATLADALGSTSTSKPIIIAALQNTLQYLFSYLVLVAVLSLVEFVTSLLVLSSLTSLANLLTLEGILEAKAAARVVMVLKTLLGTDVYDTKLMRATLKTRVDTAWSTFRAAAWVTGRHAVARRHASEVEEDVRGRDGADGDGGGAGEASPAREGVRGRVTDTPQGSPRVPPPRERSPSHWQASLRSYPSSQTPQFPKTPTRSVGAPEPVAIPPPTAAALQEDGAVTPLALRHLRERIIVAASPRVVRGPVKDSPGGPGAAKDTDVRPSAHA